MCIALGCRKDSEPQVDRTPTIETTSETEILSPVYKAELHIAMTGPTGKSFVASTLDYSSSVVRQSQNDRNVSIETKESETTKSSIGFSMEDGRYCTISPVFIKHDNGMDIWQLELQYAANKESIIKHSATKIVSASFDGQKDTVVFNDRYHTIRIRKRGDMVKTIDIVETTTE